MIDLLHAVQPSQRWIRSDLTWWNTFVSEWNGVSFLHPPTHLTQLEITSDASGTWECGAWHHNAWFQLRGDNRSQALPFAEKKLIPIILALAVWGKAWAGYQIVCHCDNQVVVACLKPRTSKSKGVMHLLRCLVFMLSQACLHSLITWQTLSPAIISLFFSQRFHIPPRYLSHYWTSWWTPRPTGPFCVTEHADFIGLT